MKKAVAFVLAMTLCLMTLMTSADFADSIYPGADRLKEHGFIQGNQHGDLMVNRDLTRAEAAKLLVELYGKIEEAKKFKYNGVFSDVKTGDWFAPYVGYAAEQKWLKGFPDGTYNPYGKVTSQAWATMLMRVLGYPNTWDTVLSDLEKVGIRIFAINRNALRRGEAFDAMWAAVNKPPYGQTKPLGEILGRLNPTPAEPEAVKVLAVGTESLKTVRLTVSGELDPASANNPANYQVVDKNGLRQEVQTARYDAANKSILLMLKQPLGSQAQFTLLLDVVAKNGERVKNEGFESFTAVDLTPPKVLSLESIGTRAFRVEFSEPIKPNSNGTLNHGDFSLNLTISIRRIVLAEDGMSAVVEFFNDVRGALKVQPQPTIKDYWGLSLISTAYTIDMKADTTPLALTGVEDITPTSATLVFNKPLSFVTSTGSYFLVNGLPADEAPTWSGNRVKLFFTKNFMRPGVNALRVSTGAVRDYSGNSSPLLDSTITVAADTTPPQAIEGPEFVAGNKIRMKFSEGLDSRTTRLGQVSNYRLFQNDGAEVSGLIRGVIYDPKTYVLEVNLSQTITGDYRLMFVELKDFAGNSGLLDYAFNARDVIPPNPANWSARVYNAGKADQLLKIRFDEPMLTSGKYSILDLENYNINGRQLDRLDPSLLRVELVDNDTSVEIAYPGTTATGGFNFGINSDPSVKELTIARVADREGNYIEPFSVSVKLAGSGHITVDKVEQIVPNKIKVEIFDRLDAISDSDFIVESSSRRNRVVEILRDISNDGKTIVELTLEETLKMPATLRTVRGQTANRFGENFADSAPIRIVDKIGPSVEQIMIDHILRDNVTYSKSSGIVSVHFTEEIDARTVSLLTFEIPGILIENITAKGSEVQIRIASADRSRIQEQDSVLQKVELRDRSGNGTQNLNLRIQKVYQ
ncbi:MAG: S-layer homology domain-containing protein [Bacillota bacterium]|nr:S-layer homology domain-containing protein [Bacillota bacterium]